MLKMKLICLWVFIVGAYRLQALSIKKSNTVGHDIEINVSYGNYHFDLSSSDLLPLDVGVSRQSDPWYLYIHVHVGKFKRIFRFNLNQNGHPHLQSTVQNNEPLVNLLKVYYGRATECKSNMKVAYLLYNDPDTGKQITLCPDQIIG